jgi:hypothetical protein
MRRVGFFNVNQNCQAADQFVRDVLSGKRIRDLVQDAHQVEQSFFKQGVDRFPVPRRIG